MCEVHSASKLLEDSISTRPLCLLELQLPIMTGELCLLQLKIPIDRLHDNLVGSCIFMNLFQFTFVARQLWLLAAGGAYGPFIPLQSHKAWQPAPTRDIVISDVLPMIFTCEIHNTEVGI